MGKEGGGGEVGSLPAGPSDCSGLQVAAAPSPAQAGPHLSTTQWGLGSMVGGWALPVPFPLSGLGGAHYRALLLKSGQAS